MCERFHAVYPVRLVNVVKESTPRRVPPEEYPTALMRMTMSHGECTSKLHMKQLVREEKSPELNLRLPIPPNVQYGETSDA